MAKQRKGQAKKRPSKEKVKKKRPSKEKVKKKGQAKKRPRNQSASFIFKGILKRPSKEKVTICYLCLSDASCSWFYNSMVLFLMSPHPSKKLLKESEQLTPINKKMMQFNPDYPINSPLDFLTKYGFLFSLTHSILWDFLNNNFGHIELYPKSTFLKGTCDSTRWFQKKI